MNLIEQFALYFFLTQLLHSFEELVTGFHKKWYLFKMPFWVFLAFEVVFNVFWGLVLFSVQFPFRERLLLLFIVLMFANGVQHLIWAGWAKKYVPGLLTAPVHIALFLAFYFQLFN